VRVLEIACSGLTKRRRGSGHAASENTCDGRRRRPNERRHPKPRKPARKTTRANVVSKSVCPKSGCRIKTRPPSRTRRPRTRYQENSDCDCAQPTPPQPAPRKPASRIPTARVKTIRSAATVRAFDFRPDDQGQNHQPRDPTNSTSAKRRTSRDQQRGCEDQHQRRRHEADLR